MTAEGKGSDQIILRNADSPALPNPSSALSTTMKLRQLRFKTLITRQQILTSFILSIVFFIIYTVYIYVYTYLSSVGVNGQVESDAAVGLSMTVNGCSCAGLPSRRKPSLADLWCGGPEGPGAF